MTYNMAVCILLLSYVSFMIDYTATGFPHLFVHSLQSFKLYAINMGTPNTYGILCQSRKLI